MLKTVADSDLVVKKDLSWANGVKVTTRFSSLSVNGIGLSVTTLMFVPLLIPV